MPDSILGTCEGCGSKQQLALCRLQDGTGRYVCRGCAMDLLKGQDDNGFYSPYVVWIDRVPHWRLGYLQL